MSYIAVAIKIKTLGLKGVWGLRPQPGVEPLHPVLTHTTVVIQPALNEALNALGKPPATGHIRDPFWEADAACVHHGNHKPDTGRQVTQVRPIPWLTDPVVQGIVEGRVFLSILVNE